MTQSAEEIVQSAEGKFKSTHITKTGHTKTSIIDHISDQEQIQYFFIINTRDTGFFSQTVKRRHLITIWGVGDDVTQVGERTNSTGARSSEILVQDVGCPSCGYEMEAALCTTDFALVVLTMIVEISAESHEESERVAKRELGVRMKDIPLTVLETRPVDEADEKPEMNFADLGRDV